MSPSSHPLSVVLAGGGTAGHIEPALAVAEALRRSRQDVRVTALGTTRGLETTLVPARGVDLELIPAVPVPRKVNKDLVTLPFRLVGALRRTRRTLKALQADVVVGFGGYVSAPAYLAAKSLGLPIVVHEANARAGVANKLGVRLGGRALAATPDSGLGPGADTEVVGIPVRDSLLSLDRGALRGEAREFFGLDPEAPVLLVTGGSQGAASINTAVSGAAGTFADAGVGVLHAYGRKNAAPADGGPGYVAVPYIDRMDLALAAADMVLCRSGAMTVAEISACGLPAVYVPLPHGNGEQELNARPVVDAGGGVIVPDAELNAGRVAREVVPLLRDKVRLRQAGEAAAAAGHRDAAERIAQIVIEAGSPAGERK